MSMNRVRPVPTCPIASNHLVMEEAAVIDNEEIKFNNFTVDDE